MRFLCVMSLDLRDQQDLQRQWSRWYAHVRFWRCSSKQEVQSETAPPRAVLRVIHKAANGRCRRSAIAAPWSTYLLTQAAGILGHSLLLGMVLP